MKCEILHDVKCNLTIDFIFFMLLYLVMLKKGSIASFLL